MGEVLKWPLYLQSTLSQRLSNFPLLRLTTAGKGEYFFTTALLLKEDGTHAYVAGVCVHFCSCVFDEMSENRLVLQLLLPLAQFFLLGAWDWEYNLRLALLKPRDASCDGDTSVEEQRVITLYDSAGVRNSSFTVDGDHQACVGWPGDMIIGDPYSSTVFGVRLRVMN